MKGDERRTSVAKLSLVFILVMFLIKGLNYIIIRTKYNKKISLDSCTLFILRTKDQGGVVQFCDVPPTTLNRTL